jgi:hypothetical protein
VLHLPYPSLVSLDEDNVRLTPIDSVPACTVDTIICIDMSLRIFIPEVECDQRDRRVVTDCPAAPTAVAASSTPSATAGSAFALVTVARTTFAGAALAPAALIAATATIIGDLQPGGVTAGDGVAACVGVAVVLLGAGGLEERVGGLEGAGDRVIPPGADVGEAGGGVGGLSRKPRLSAQVTVGPRGAP